MELREEFQRHLHMWGLSGLCVPSILTRSHSHSGTDLLSFVKEVFCVVGISVGVGILQGTKEVNIFAPVVFMLHSAGTFRFKTSAFKPHLLKTLGLNPNSEEIKLPSY